MAQQSVQHLPRRNGHAYHEADAVQNIHALHQAGLKADHAQVPALLDVVNNPPDHFHFFEAVHALARIGDMQAVPVLEAAMQRYARDLEAHGFADVARARLLSEAQAHKHPQGQARAQALLSHFFSMLHLDAATLNANVEQDWKHWLLNGGNDSTRSQLAMRELADIIYLHRDQALAHAAMSAGVRFDLDAGAKYKVQLALLSSQQRVDWLIHELADKKAIKAEDLYLLQLAADEGKLASRAAATKLKDMDQHRERYINREASTQANKYFMGFPEMLRILQAVGDRDQEPVVAHFVNDKEHWISLYGKQAYPYVKAGVPWKWRIGY